MSRAKRVDGSGTNPNGLIENPRLLRMIGNSTFAGKAGVGVRAHRKIVHLAWIASQDVSL